MYVLNHLFRYIVLSRQLLKAKIIMIKKTVIRKIIIVIRNTIIKKYIVSFHPLLFLYKINKRTVNYGRYFNTFGSSISRLYIYLHNTANKFFVFIILSGECCATKTHFTHKKNMVALKSLSFCDVVLRDYREILS